jgi:hypothetical protein
MLPEPWVTWLPAGENGQRSRAAKQAGVFVGLFHELKNLDLHGQKLREDLLTVWGERTWLNRLRHSDWRGQLTSPKNGKVRFVAMTERVAAALRKHRHLRSPRVLCKDDG